MATPDIGVLGDLAIVAATGVVGGVGWLFARVFTQGGRLSRVEAALKSMYDAIDKLGDRATAAENAHLAMTRGLGDVKTQLGVLGERSVAQGKTLDNIDNRLQELFSPTTAARTRANKALG